MTASSSISQGEAVTIKSSTHHPTPGSIRSSAVAGANAVGQNKRFTPLPRSNTLKVLGSPLFSTGRIAATHADDRVIEFTLDGKHYWFVFSGRTLAGANLFSDTSLSSPIKKVLREGVDCSSILPNVEDFSLLSAFLKVVEINNQI